MPPLPLMHQRCYWGVEAMELLGASTPRNEAAANLDESPVDIHHPAHPSGGAPGFHALVTPPPSCRRVRE
jgi:hypothetical protein